METIGNDLRQMQRTPLAGSHVAALRAAGEIVHYPAGTFLTHPGDPIDRFTYIEAGEVEVVNPYTDERHLPSTLGPNAVHGRDRVPERRCLDAADARRCRHARDRSAA